jgi:hypothetical protein
LILSRDWSEKLHGYFSTDWSHLWLPFNGRPNQIKVEREKHMKYIVTNLNDPNETDNVFKFNIEEIFALTHSSVIFLQNPHPL